MVVRMRDMAEGRIGMQGTLASVPYGLGEASVALCRHVDARYFDRLLRLVYN